MTIKIGDRIPSATLNTLNDGVQAIRTDELFKGKTVVLFSVPGAFTPTCSAKHVPGYVEKHAELKAAGIDEVWCVSVNDAFVMGAWGRDQHTAGSGQPSPIANAVVSSSAASPTSVTGRSACAAARSAISGPIPAGSPVVRAINAYSSSRSST